MVRCFAEVTHSTRKIAPLLEMKSELCRSLQRSARIPPLNPLPDELMQSRTPQGRESLVDSPMAQHMKKFILSCDSAVRPCCRRSPANELLAPGEPFTALLNRLHIIEPIPQPQPRPKSHIQLRCKRPIDVGPPYRGAQDGARSAL